jgi:hypothetical protein
MKLIAIFGNSLHTMEPGLRIRYVHIHNMRIRIHHNKKNLDPDLELQNTTFLKKFKQSSLILITLNCFELEAR